MRRLARVAALLLAGGAQLAAAAISSDTQVYGNGERGVPEATPVPAPVVDELSEIVIQAPEPRYVAPTRRDRIGRIWAPVMIDGKGPFRMVLDTGATNSAIMDSVAAALGIDPSTAPKVRLRGVTGTATVPLVRAKTLAVGDLYLENIRMPIVINALGGAQGVLGTEGFDDKRVLIDFRNDLILINRSREQPAGLDQITVPFTREKGLLVISAYVGGIATRAIIDTGGQATIGNLALRDALLRERFTQKITTDVIIGATEDEQRAEGYPAPAIRLRDLTVQGAHITFGNMDIFEHWGMTKQPAVLIGMDTLGLLDLLVIDYRRRELQLRLVQPRRS